MSDITDMEDRIKSALQDIPADCRDTCIKVGMGIHSELGETGYCIWDDWLRTGNKYHKQEMLNAWKSFKSGKITIGTVFYLANDNNY